MLTRSKTFESFESFEAFEAFEAFEPFESFESFEGFEPFDAFEPFANGWGRQVQHRVIDRSSAVARKCGKTVAGLLERLERLKRLERLERLERFERFERPYGTIKLLRSTLFPCPTISVGA
jgi:hypothetical protein